MRRTFLGLATCALLTATMALGGAAQAVQTPQNGTVSANPADFTPHVLDGEVYAVAVVGDTVVLGGRFTQARNAPDGSPAIARSNLLAYNKTTGAIVTTFAPVVNDYVRSLVASPDGTSVYVAGQFGSIDGKAAYKLARLDVTTGAPIAGFKPGRIDAAVMDVRLSGDRLFIGGKFTTVGGQPRTYLAEVSPTTGLVRTNVNIAISTPVWSGTSFVNKTDVSPDGTRMVVVGNFRSIGGQTKSQVAMLDLTTNPVTVLPWASPAFDVKCGSSNSTGFDARDVDFSPDGSYFVIGSTGGHTYPGAVCDGVSRWETNRTGPGQQPTWVAMTGGDSVYAVASTGAAIYAGGHFRWFNNPVFIQSYKGPGAVDREGIAALDPVTGVPLTWNPGRDRGMAVWDLVATSDGLYLGDDTERIGRYEYHARNAFFPLAGGAPVPQPVTLPLPVDTQLIAPASAPDSLVRRRGFNGTTAGPAETLAAAGAGWSAVRGAFMAEGSLYSVRGDKTMVKQAVTATTFGPAAPVNLYGLTAFADRMPDITSMFYGEGRLYYTVTGQNALFMRFFTVQSDLVGATEYTASGPIAGLDWTSVRGAFLVDGQLYVANASTGDLSRVTWTNRAPVAGSAVIVSGPGSDGIDWRSAGLFVRPATASPVVTIAQSCNGTLCTLTGFASGLGTAHVTSWAWDLGDGSTASGQQVVYDFEPGTAHVTLTVLTDEGVTAVGTTDVVVANAAPTASIAVSCSGLLCTGTGAESGDVDGYITSYAWDFGDGFTAKGITASHTYAGAGAQTVTLVVTDNRDATGSAAAVAQPVSSTVSYVATAANTAQVTATTRSVVLPAAVLPGDTLVMFWSANGADLSAAAPSGWVVQGSAATTASATKVWTRTAIASDAGATVPVSSGTALKADLVVAVYRGAQVGAFAVAPETAVSASHTTPTAPVVQGGSWVLSYWADKSGATTSWAPPAGVTSRFTAAGSGAGHVSELLTDSAGAVPVGTTGGLVATANSAQKNATMVTVVLGSAG